MESYLDVMHSSIVSNVDPTLSSHQLETSYSTIEPQNKKDISFKTDHNTSNASFSDLLPADRHLDHFDWSFSSVVSDITVKEALNNGNFWSDFSKVNATPDGHCIVHSVCMCMCALLRKNGVGVMYSEILAKLRSECLSNMSLYIPAITDCNPKNMILEMIRYIYLKDYNSSFGDIVPIVLSSALSLNVFVIEHRSNNVYNVHAAYLLENMATFNVFLYKRGEHYDACIPRSFLMPDISDQTSQ